MSGFLFVELEIYGILSKGELMEILLSTNNKSKVNFIKQAAAGLGLEFRTLKDLGLKLEVEETGKTAVENAMIKARALSVDSGMPTLGWDMGMRIDALPEKMQPNLHVRRANGDKELTDAEMVEYWRKVVEQYGKNGESLAHYFDGVAIAFGNQIIHSQSFDEDPFVFTAKEKIDGVAKFNTFDRVRKTLDGKYFCDLTDEENLRYDQKRAESIRKFIEVCLEKLLNNQQLGVEHGR